MNHKRGPLNDPMLPEATSLTDRFFVDTKTEDRHFDAAMMEQIADRSTLSEQEVVDLHLRLTLQKMFTRL